MERDEWRGCEGRVAGLARRLGGLALTLGGANIAAALIAYRAVYSRWERPDYSTVLGEYYYPRIADRLPRRTFDYYPWHNLACGSFFPWRDVGRATCETDLARARFFSMRDIGAPMHGHRLRGYFYPARHPRGTVVFRHGLRSGADDYLPLIAAIVAAGYDLFTFDGTGAFDSAGDGTGGAPQWPLDLAATVAYLRSAGALRNDIPLYLVGHSLGGYAVAAALSLIDGVSACVSVAGMNDGVGLLADTAARYIRLRSALAIPSLVFREYQRLLYGRYADMTAVRGINSAAIPTLLVHGRADRILPLDGLSINAHADKITNPRVEYRVTPAPNDGHDTVLLSGGAITYRSVITAERAQIESRRGRALTRAERAALSSRIDHRKYSEPSPTLVEGIVHTLERAEKCGK